MRRDSKYVVFNNKEEANRFKQVYGGLIEDMNKTGYYEKFYVDYFGDKIFGKVLVITRQSKDEFDEIIRVLELKKKKWNGKLIYVF